jgi:flagellar basal body-associated protein FliL
MISVRQTEMKIQHEEAKGHFMIIIIIIVVVVVIIGALIY